MTKRFGTFLALFVFFVLEVLCALLWASGTFGMSAITFTLLGGEPEANLGWFWTLFGIWGVLFAIPALLQMVQSAIWARGLTQTAKDLGVEEILPKKGEK